MGLKASIAAGCFLVLTARLAGAADNPPPSMVVEAEELAKPEFAKGVRVLDARVPSRYSARHIVGAVWVDLIAWEKAFDDNRDVRFWEKEIGALGIDGNTPVIIYDNGSGYDAARIWWILRFWGVKDVRLLNSGWAGWLFVRKPSSGTRTQVEARSIKLQPQYARLAVKRQVLEIVQSRRELLIDVRTDREFRGIESRAVRKGFIPSARRLDWFIGLEPYYNMARFKSVEGLTEAFRKAGIDPARPITVYGNNDDRGALMAFSLERIGAKDVRVYFRGWEEWGNTKDTPIVEPEKKKT